MQNLKFETLFDQTNLLFEENSQKTTKSGARWKDFKAKGGTHKTDKDKSKSRTNLKKEVKKELKDLGESLKKACWKGYKAIGTKKKNGKKVPNCVPVQEDYEVLPDFDRERYTSLEAEGLEGPFRLKSGKIVYYDPRVGKYYDRDSDMYLSQEDYEAHNSPRKSLFNNFKEAFESINESSCTGPTEKASSTSKGKKWMQCVKNPDGKGYKRVHWGQKGVRVTGKSGDTKRKKSFKSRHKCSSAKPGTPKYQACKDWK